MGTAPAPEYGETWVYESIIGALPGISVSRGLALAIQLLLFEAGVLVFAAYYELWSAAIAGTVAVLVAALGSFEMLRISRISRSVEVPPVYRRLLFGSSFEVVLAVLAYIALVTHLFVFDPQQRGPQALVTQLFGPDPPVVVVYLTLLVLWDVCYRIGTNWWAAVTAVWRSFHLQLDTETRAVFRRVDLESIAFGTLQLVLVPFVLDQPVILAALVAHVGAIVATNGLAIGLSYR